MKLYGTWTPGTERGLTSSTSLTPSVVQENLSNPMSPSQRRLPPAVQEPCLLALKPPVKYPFLKKAHPL